MSRDWDKELARIDKQLESLSDEALLPADKEKGATPRPSAAAPAAPSVVTGRPAPGNTAATGTPQQERTRTLGVMLRLLLAGALGIGMMFWPYKAACGLDLLGYLGAVSLVSLAGAWSAVWSWRHRSARAHVIALALVGWGIALAAVEVLPRIGYAQPDPTRTLWVCE